MGCVHQSIIGGYFSTVACILCMVIGILLYLAKVSNLIGVMVNDNVLYKMYKKNLNYITRYFIIHIAFKVIFCAIRMSICASYYINYKELSTV